MNRSNTWKLFFTALLIAVSISLILPFEDRVLGDYALSQVTSDANASNHAGHEKFSEVIDNLRLQLPEDQPIDYASLRDYGKRNRLDYAAYFEAPSGIIGTVGLVFIGLNVAINSLYGESIKAETGRQTLLHA